MECDNEAEAFSEALFTYLWFTENLISLNTAASIAGDFSNFIPEIARNVTILSLMDHSFNESMDEYFKRHDMSRLSVFTFLSKYSFDNHAKSYDIFRVVMDTCSFVYRLVMFCLQRGHGEYVQFAAMCWTEIFEADLKEEFDVNGGFDVFLEYASSNNYDIEGTYQEAFFNFMLEIDFLFPPLKLSEPQPEYEINISTSTDSSEHDKINFSEQTDSLSPAMLKPGDGCQNTNSDGVSCLFVASDNSGEENEEEESEADEQFGTQLNPKNEESSGQSTPDEDSDEELQKLVKVGMTAKSTFRDLLLSED